MIAQRPTKGEWIVICTGLLIVVDLVVVPWYRIRIGLGDAGKISIDKRAVDSPNAAYAIAALVIVVLLLLMVSGRLRSVRGRWYSPAQLRILRLGGAISCGLLVAKLMMNTDYLGPGSWLGVLLGVVMVYGALAIDAERPAGDPPLLVD
jgi:hypothetical protein